MDIDIKSMTPAQRKQLMEDLRKAEEAEKNAYKQEFLGDVVKLASEKGVKWSEARTLINGYKPSSDTEAKKLGFTHKKGKDYYLRDVKGATKLK
ncbi:hypothetical protein RAZWK3B_20651 [Roseobacter sp. AzwK-3b]|uniref:hypothetical protein n=1 Tax=Roseobacter sp. AzwK-3b TaxID=351016 RepID=UPI0001569C1D|nr:hypothetical protein [Roseobacter sp. AzwK-3b]EDM71801.1 hypothetical protein RAZWK3B_20651 [Roseobacter sp. AzwK-3b]